MSTLPVTRKRNAEFITPPNLVKLKVGAGGIPASLIERAQQVIESQSTDDFIVMGQRFLAAFQEGIRLCETRFESLDTETLMSTLIHPAMQLKANGAMFGFPLVTTLSGKLIHILEYAEEPNKDLIDLMDAFHTVLRAIIVGNLAGDGGRTGQELVTVLDTACERYTDKYGITL